MSERERRPSSRRRRNENERGFSSPPPSGVARDDARRRVGSEAEKPGGSNPPLLKRGSRTPSRASPARRAVPDERRGGLGRRANARTRSARARTRTPALSIAEAHRASTRTVEGGPRAGIVRARQRAPRAPRPTREGSKTIRRRSSAKDEEGRGQKGGEGRRPPDEEAAETAGEVAGARAVRSAHAPRWRRARRARSAERCGATGRFMAPF